MRGSGRFALISLLSGTTIEVSIPFIAGQWSLRKEKGNGNDFRQVSIPFIAGQWSLLPARDPFYWSLAGVSIPFSAGQWSLRGGAATNFPMGFWFQSPSLRGSGRFSFRVLGVYQGLYVSIPFIAGQWSLPPIFGAAIALGIKVSIPFIAGQWSLLLHY